MALSNTTLSSAITADATFIKVASATGAGKGKVIKVGDEFMVQTRDADANATTLLPVRRGQNATQAKAWPASTVVSIGSAALQDGAPDFAGSQVDTPSSYPLAGKQKRILSYSAAGAITLPSPGTDMVAVLNGTGTEAYSVAAPTKDQDGDELTILCGGAGAKTITFTGGLSLAGTSYDVYTANAGAPTGLKVIACNGAWIMPVGVAMTGTVTNLTGGIA